MVLKYVLDCQRVNMQILLVEDDQHLNGAIAEALSDADYEVDSVFDAHSALENIRTQEYNIIISDIKMPGMSGYAFLEKVKALDIPTPVLLMTAYGTIEQAVNALKLGACDYITKPFDVDTLINKIKLHATQLLPAASVISESTSSKQIFDLAKKVAKTDASVLIQGESGTGKEVLARFIHAQSPRKDKPFVGINCAAIPDNMLESTLFGYEKGAFTGAHQATPGKFEQANGGTLLLDEISEMPLNLQVKLLRVLQENEVERLGGKKYIPLDVRIIATTNRTLSEEVKAQNFREDLYFRLNVFPITWTPLRARKDDIVPLCERFIQQFSPGKQLSDEAKSTLMNYAWPGNIRELQNVIQRAVILASNELVDVEHLIFEQHQTEIDSTDLNENLSQTEFKTIQNVLNQTQGNRQEAADILGISPRTLRYKIAKMKSLGLKVE